MNLLRAGGILALLAWIVSNACAASTDAAAPVDDPHTNWLPLGLESYEPSAFGYQKNNDDVSFENIKLSVKFPLLPKLTQKYLEDRDRFFISFTGVWDFYITTRPSGPVVGKEYNPQLLWQHNLSCKTDSGGKYRAGPTYESRPTPPPSESGPEVTNSSVTSGPESRNCYVSIGYNHDSNGQIINSLGQFEQTRRAQGTEAALDAISRGWDYIGITGKYIPFWTPTQKVTVYPILKYFLNDGLLQGDPEELHFWEHPADGKPRKEVDGVGVLFKYQRRFVGLDSKIALGYGTGYQDAFRYNTIRVEAGVAPWQLPLVFWAQKGYMADLSQWYRKVTGYGVEIEIGGF